MPDRKKIMSWLEGLAQQDWRMFHSDSEVQEIARNALELLEEDCHNCKLECLLQKYDELKEKYDAMLKEHQDEIYALRVELASSNELAEGYAELLKEQEPVAPVLVGRMWECGKCHAPVGIFMDDQRDQFCRTCGRSVKWE